MENCYFCAKETGSDNGLNVWCEKCRTTNHPGLGWFWEGSKLGYGPFDFICADCGFIIHSSPENVIES